jgi:hypothetical protein
MPLIDRRRTLAAGLGAAALTRAPFAFAKGDNVTDTAAFSAMAMQLTARSLERLSEAAAARAAILTHIAEIEGQIRTSAIFVAQYSGRPVNFHSRFRRASGLCRGRPRI